MAGGRLWGPKNGVFLMFWIFCCQERRVSAGLFLGCSPMAGGVFLSPRNGVLWWSGLREFVIFFRAVEIRKFQRSGPGEKKPSFAELPPVENVVWRDQIVENRRVREGLHSECSPMAGGRLWGPKNGVFLVVWIFCCQGRRVSAGLFLHVPRWQEVSF